MRFRIGSMARFPAEKYLADRDFPPQKRNPDTMDETWEK